MTGPDPTRAPIGGATHLPEVARLCGGYEAALRILSRQALERTLFAEEALSACHHALVSDLTGIGTGLHLLRRKVGTDCPKDIADLFDRMKDSVTRAAARLDRRVAMRDACSESSMERPAPPTAETAPFESVLQGAIEATRTSKSVTVSLVDIPNVPISGELTELSVALECVIENAIEAVVESGGGEVKLVGSRAGADILLSIEDDGPGFGDGATRAFEPFYSRKRGHPGLGLSVARRVVLRHGGQIDVDTKATRGGRVVMRLR